MITKYKLYHGLFHFLWSYNILDRDVSFFSPKREKERNMVGTKPRESHMLGKPSTHEATSLVLSWFDYFFLNKTFILGLILHKISYLRDTVFVSR